MVTPPLTYSLSHTHSLTHTHTHTHTNTHSHKTRIHIHTEREREREKEKERGRERERTHCTCAGCTSPCLRMSTTAWTAASLTCTSAWKNDSSTGSRNACAMLLLTLSAKERERDRSPDVTRYTRIVRAWWTCPMQSFHRIFFLFPSLL